MTSEQIEVTYKATTPLFCGGSTSDITEIRVSSIKGMLRWWWRALAWPRYEGSEADKLHAIHHDEAELFGSAVRGQSKVILRLLPPTVTPTTLRVGDTLSLDGKAVREGARYLGYGVMVADQGGPAHAAMPPGTTGDRARASHARSGTATTRTAGRCRQGARPARRPRRQEPERLWQPGPAGDLAGQLSQMGRTGLGRRSGHRDRPAAAVRRTVLPDPALHRAVGENPHPARAGPRGTAATRASRSRRSRADALSQLGP
ncbi:MAG: type III-B CRISPR module RAMP protein Cmr1 [Deltaproteobacteria bacterium]|nr:MAG: type III-B CRISPR module RAMP protein Cmr1 [Deltaproteobacteria bacterium]